MKGKEFSKDREFAVILEELRTNFKVVIEDLGSLKKKVDGLFEELGNQKEAIFVIKAEISAIKTELSIIKEDLKVIKTDIAEIKVTLKGHAKRLSQLETVK